ncbi:MAG: FtsB family cell division protein [Elusimicrobiales bacterium]
MRRKRIKNSVIRWGIIALGLLFSLPAVWNLAVNTYRVYHLKKRLKNLELENIRLKEEIKQTKKPDYIERVARLKLGLKKPDEIEYRFVYQAKE